MFRRKPRKPVPRFNCPNCGEEVKITAKACPYCGADDETGWKENAGSLLYQEEDFDYDEFLKKEFGGSGVKPQGTPWWVWILSIMVLVALVLYLLR